MIRNFQSGDIVTSGDDQFVTGKESTLHGLAHRLKMFLGEFFLDISDGTPWFQSILGKNPQDIAEINLKQRIITSPDVVGITRFEFSSNAIERKISIDADIVDVNNEIIQLYFNEDII